MQIKRCRAFHGGEYPFRMSLVVKSGDRACGLQPAVAIISLKGPPASDVSGPLGVS